MTTITRPSGASALPPGPTSPRLAQAIYALTMPHRGMRRLRARYGDAFTINSAIFGRALVISDAGEIKQLFQASTEDVDNIERNLSRVLGKGSIFGLIGDEHRKRRKLLVPPFHGRRLVAYERIVEEETRREIASWPQGTEFAMLPSTNRITINVILRAVFGAQGAELAELRELLPRMVTIGSRLAVLPLPELNWKRFNPWNRFRALRRQYNGIITRLIDTALADPELDQRDDILAMMLASRYEDGSAMSHHDIADELLTLLSAGHETTATTLAWAVERLRRHPSVLAELVAEADTDASTLRQATITEVQRVRPVIDMVGRTIRTDDFQLGRWTLPKGHTVLVSINLLHDDPTVFPNPRAFDPSRFVGSKPDLNQWIPFGGGTRRCIGAAFANMELNVVLRTILREVTLVPTDQPDERWHSRGIASAPADGGLTVIRPRTDRPVSSDTESANHSGSADVRTAS